MRHLTPDEHFDSLSVFYRAFQRPLSLKRLVLILTQFRAMSPVNVHSWSRICLSQHSGSCHCSFRSTPSWPYHHDPTRGLHASTPSQLYVSDVACQQALPIKATLITCLSLRSHSPPLTKSVNLSEALSSRSRLGCQTVVGSQRPACFSLAPCLQRSSSVARWVVSSKSLITLVINTMVAQKFNPDNLGPVISGLTPLDVITSHQWASHAVKCLAAYLQYFIVEFAHRPTFSIYHLVFRKFICCVHEPLFLTIFYHGGAHDTVGDPIVIAVQSSLSVCRYLLSPHTLDSHVKVIRSIPVLSDCSIYFSFLTC